MSSSSCVLPRKPHVNITACARRTVPVILLQDVDTLAVAGQEVPVRPGFARNFLLPQKLAVYATEDNRKLHKKDFSVCGHRCMSWPMACR